MGRIVVLDNPLLQDILAKLRDRETDIPDFRELTYRAGVYIGYELARYLPTREVNVVTPLNAVARGVEVEDHKVIILAVLRAAIPLAYGMVQTLRRARLGVVAAKRSEDEHAVERGYRMDVLVSYFGLPSNGEILVVTDPMLATGSTLRKILFLLREKNRFEKTFVVSIISTKLGIERIFEVEPEATIFTLAIDPELNEKAYIVPGLGDAGDRAFG